MRQQTRARGVCLGPLRAVSVGVFMSTGRECVQALEVFFLHALTHSRGKDAVLD